VSIVHHSHPTSHSHCAYSDCHATALSIVENIHCIQVHPLQEHVLVTSTGGKYGNISLYDVRKAGDSWEPFVTLSEHTKAINGFRMSPDGHYLVSVSQDDTVKIWRNFLSQDDYKVTSIDHFHNNDDRRRFVSTILPVFDLKHTSTFALGSMESPRRIEIFELPQRAAGDESELTVSPPSLLINEDLLTTICARVCFHPFRNVVVGGNASGKVYLFKQQTNTM
jgi:WD40 repeat protein